jgi:hypothetical protein
MTTEARAVVAITGVAGQLGDTLAQLLETDDRVAKSEINGPLVDFLCYPPVPDNARLKRDAGFTFRYTSRQAIDDYFRARGARS